MDALPLGSRTVFDHNGVMNYTFRGFWATMWKCALSVVALVSLSSCGSDSSPRTISVPTDAPTIQEAVDLARSGDLVLIEAGTYNEAVSVDTKGITIRGTDRNAVVLDGIDKYANGITVTTGGVTVENLTVRRYQQNGILFTGALPSETGKAGYKAEAGEVLDGYRISYVTTYNNGLYGVYAFASRNGLIENSYASGHPDSGFYVGQCKPCNVVMRNLIAENNAIGYYGTNASDNVWIINSEFSRNRLGIAPNSQDAERLAPQESTVVAGNLVADNDNAKAPKIPQGFFGAGIAVGGGTKNTIIRNKVVSHDGAGIIVVSMNKYEPSDNQITENKLFDNGTDLVYSSTRNTANGNCFARNIFSTSSPKNIEDVMECGKTDKVPALLFTLPVAPNGPSYRDIPIPPPQKSLDNAKTRMWSPVTGEPIYPKIEDITLPK